VAMMCKSAARRVTKMTLAAFMPGLVAVSAAHTEKPDDVARLIAEVGRLHQQGKYAEAIPFAEEAVSLTRKRYREEHAEFASAMEWLAFVYGAQGRYSDAEPLLKHSLGIWQATRGPLHPDVAASLNNLSSDVRRINALPDFPEWVRFGHFNRIFKGFCWSGDRQFADAALIEPGHLLSAEKIAAIFIVFLPPRALHLHPVAFAGPVRRLLALRHDALEAAWSAFRKELLAVLEGFGIPHTRVVVPAQQRPEPLLPSD
jgi:tetratricopeptide (TPR) repeat protein